MHTKGPWVQFVDRGNGYAVEVLPAMREGRIARLERDEEHDAEDVDANARLIAAAPDGFALAKFIKEHSVQEELSTHVAVSMSEEDLGRLLHMAERFLRKCGSPQADGAQDSEAKSNG